MPVKEALGGEAKMCLLCAAGLEGRRLARRAHVLQLLALVEHPDALPADAALRLAREVLTLTQPDRTGRRCEPVVPPGSAIEEAR
jgi:indole-3-glycerol phosphate synthase